LTLIDAVKNLRKREWKLNKDVFLKLLSHEPLLNYAIDLLASRSNARLPLYVAWKPDPYAMFIDAFTLHRGQFKFFYAFPPFSLISEGFEEVQGGQGRRTDNGPRMKESELVPDATPNVPGNSATNAASPEITRSTAATQKSAHVEQDSELVSCAYIRKSLERRGIVGDAADLCLRG
jgi:hypothetical protein